MFKQSILIFFVVILTACTAQLAPSFQKDRAPEVRNEYSGIEGAFQQQKDKIYLMTKELSDKCKNGQIDLAVAKHENNKILIKKYKKHIHNSCV